MAAQTRTINAAERKAADLISSLNSARIPGENCYCKREKKLIK